MIKIDGEAPELEGQFCDELLCQQYWHLGKLSDEADVILLKLAGCWHQAYFDSGVVHWREQEGEPGAADESQEDAFRYPLVNLGERFDLKGRRIAGYRLQETPEGEILSLEFQGGGTLSFVNQGDSTSVRYQRV